MQLWIHVEDDETGEQFDVEVPMFSTHKQIFELAAREQLLRRRRRQFKSFLARLEYIRIEMDKI